MRSAGKACRGPLHCEKVMIYSTMRIVGRSKERKLELFSKSFTVCDVDEDETEIEVTPRKPRFCVSLAIEKGREKTLGHTIKLKMQQINRQV